MLLRVGYTLFRGQISIENSRRTRSCDWSVKDEIVVAR